MQNTTGKLIERIVGRKFAQDSERRNVLPPNQGGYKQEKKTLGKTQPGSHTMSTKDSRERNKLAVAVVLEDVYNRMYFKLLMELLVQYGVSLMFTR